MKIMIWQDQSASSNGTVIFSYIDWLFAHLQTKKEEERAKREEIYADSQRLLRGNDDLSHYIKVMSCSSAIEIEHFLMDHRVEGSCICGSSTGHETSVQCIGKNTSKTASTRMQVLSSFSCFTSIMIHDFRAMRRLTIGGCYFSGSGAGTSQESETKSVSQPGRKEKSNSYVDLTVDGDTEVEIEIFSSTVVKKTEEVKTVETTVVVEVTRVCFVEPLRSTHVPTFLL